MLHPYSINSFEIEATLELCTVYKGVPYGQALITYKDPNREHLSFKGLGIFNEGKLHKTPCTFIDSDRYRFQMTSMINGRP